jgi:hypothetical protein
MKRFIISVFVVTSISIIYVFQHTKMLEYSYDINFNQEYASLLIDQNRNLRYNITKLERPSRLEETVLAQKKSEFQMPQSWHKIKLEEDVPETVNKKTPVTGYKGVGGMLLSMFSFGAEAVAYDKANR